MPDIGTPMGGWAHGQKRRVEKAIREANVEILLRKLAEVTARLADDAGRCVDASDIREMMGRMG